MIDNDIILWLKSFKAWYNVSTMSKNRKRNFNPSIILKYYCKVSLHIINKIVDSDIILVLKPVRFNINITSKNYLIQYIIFKI